MRGDDGSNLELSRVSGQMAPPGVNRAGNAVASASYIAKAGPTRREDCCDPEVPQTDAEEVWSVAACRDIGRMGVFGRKGGGSNENGCFGVCFFTRSNSTLATAVL